MIYSSFMKQLLENGLIPQEAVSGKRVLLIGGDYFNRDMDHKILPKEITQEFQRMGATQCDNLPLFSANLLDSVISIEDIGKALGENIYDFIFVLDGMERVPSFKRAAALLEAACSTTGWIFLLARTPYSLGKNFNFYYYEDRWRYEISDIKNLFVHCTVEVEVLSHPEYLAAVRLRKQLQPQKSMVPENYSLYNCRVGHRCSFAEQEAAGYFHTYRRLDAIGMAEHTDKCSMDHDYLDKYEFFLKKYQQDVFQLLELGVCNGSSERMWKAYFPNARIYGVDILEVCLQHKAERIEILIGDLAKQDVLVALRDIKPKIIVDDASHLWSHQILALFTLFDVLPSGGIYILEDMETSLNTELFPGFNDAEISAYEVCSRIARVAASKIPYEQGPYQEEIYKIGMQTEMISFIKGSCIFVKR